MSKHSKHTVTLSEMYSFFQVCTQVVITLTLSMFTAWIHIFNERLNHYETDKYAGAFPGKLNLVFVVVAVDPAVQVRLIAENTFPNCAARRNFRFATFLLSADENAQKQADDLGVHFTDKFIQDPEHVTLLLTLLEVLKCCCFTDKVSVQLYLLQQLPLCMCRWGFRSLTFMCDGLG